MTVTFLGVILTDSTFKRIPVIRLANVPSERSVVNRECVFPTLVRGSIVSMDRF